jgi:hypothetical protein
MYSPSKKKTTGIEHGVSRRAGFQHNFRIRRFCDDHGFQVYALENRSEKRVIFVPRFVFGPFRACIRAVLREELSRPKPQSFERSVSFLNREYFYLRSTQAGLNNLIIQDIDERDGSSDYITVSRGSLAVLDDLLYSDKLQHPNDVLEEIISYHKLFQFSFVKGSKSINSDLILRKDVLQQIDRHIPSLAEKVVIEREDKKAKTNSGSKPEIDRRRVAEQAEVAFRTKLGERHNEKEIRVDYEELFGNKSINLPLESEVLEVETRGNNKTAGKSFLPQFHIPLSASDIKSFDLAKLHFELSAVEATEFRERFLKDRSADFYLGFELVDALFTQNRQVKTLRFPLYYMKVQIREAGRRLYLEPRENGLFYLNHIALANLVEKFSEGSKNSEAIDKFFKTLLAQDISVDRLNDRIRLARYLPIKESIFDRSREVLFGYIDENGKGGILSDLKVDGIECDLENVYLYRAPKLLNPLDQALGIDLDEINAIAHQSMGRFYDSLLGRFLVPEQQAEQVEVKEFAPMHWIPGAPPKSTRNLVERLNKHDIVLLEGPPGTGKTHTIMDLLIHCVSMKKRVLIVSDQQGAIEALAEKFEDYLVGDETDDVAQRRWKDLLFGAVKVVGEIETGDYKLADLIDELAKTFAVSELPPGTPPPAKSLKNKLQTVKASIQKHTDSITGKLKANMDESVVFDHRVSTKVETRVDNQQLLEFLAVVQGSELAPRNIIDRFIRNRFTLVEQNLLDCYPFFKIPSRNIEQEIAALRDDKTLLSEIIRHKVKTVEDYTALTRNHPGHELVRYLETVIKRQASPEGHSVSRMNQKVKAVFRPPLLTAGKLLHDMVRDQLELLEMFQTWPENLWDLLRDLHETIRNGSAPHPALTLYRSLKHGDKAQAEARGDGSIQGNLEEIGRLYKQHDEIVRQQFVENLRQIVRDATTSKSGSGTSRATSIMALLDSLKQFESVSDAGSLFTELAQAAYDTFPVWIARKQVVPLLLPCIEQSFDLVIIDEATQCRVDDSLPLMFRASKIMVVGDDKQTVLQKDSVIDDYLFKDHELDEHLRSTQARRFKGGGSNLFALIKSIKQASVMLDEHYRCPAEVIEFSNRFVYDSELKVMQWRLPEHDSAVEVNYGEKLVEFKPKPTSGKFKGIETAMIDRFLEYVTDSIRTIERKTGKTINVEKDVALCYFLMKNEVYVRSVKDAFLRKLKRGDEILDGAGAELQGKERDYIFYLWDVTRHNMGAFKQGDDPVRRKGELNVLLSRPKKKAFHYLHRDFDQLDQGRTNITRYLGQTYHRQEDADKVHPIAAADGSVQDSLLGGLLKFTLGQSDSRGLREVRLNLNDNGIELRENIVVGDPARAVDLVAFASNAMDRFVGLVDLSAFGCDENAGQDAVDYFFQVGRASPRIDPVFAFPHELIDEHGQSFRALVQRLEQIEVPRTRKRKATGS